MGEQGPLLDPPSSLPSPLTTEFSSNTLKAMVAQAGLADILVERRGDICSGVVSNRIIVSMSCHWVGSHSAQRGK